MRTDPPPHLFVRFFRWYCHPKLQDHIEGDLMEVYNERVKTSGKRKADIKFIIDVSLLFRLAFAKRFGEARPGIIRPAEEYRNLNSYGMYKSYFKIAWRNLLNQRGCRLPVSSCRMRSELKWQVICAILVGSW